MNSDESSVNAEDVAKKWKTRIISIANSISFDAACSLLLSSKEVLKGSFKNGEHISTYFCPKCSAPWIAGNYISRLLSFPRNSRTIKTLKKKEKLNRLSKKKFFLLSASRNNSNIFKVTCTLCHHSVTNKFKIPKREKYNCILASAAGIPENSVNSVHKKKKKRKPKDKNAGLFLDSSIRHNAGIESSFISSANDKPSSFVSLANDRPICKITKINTLLSDSEKSSSSDSDDEIRFVNKNNLNKIDKPSQNKQYYKCKALVVTSFVATVKEKGKKNNSTETKLNEKRKKKLKQILAPSSIMFKQRPAGLASFLSSVF